MQSAIRILVAPLNWGLGHATRCIPIIDALIEHGYEPVIASDGCALELLKKEYPQLIHLDLPSYKIRYSKKSEFLKLKLLIDAPTILNAIKKESALIKEFIVVYNIRGIISDNRFGVYNKNIPSVFITHQVQVLSGITTWLSSKLHQNFIRKFDECWVPDIEGVPNLSGKMGHLKNGNLNIKYIGFISRFKKQILPIKYNLLVLLSGPEPQRSFLEKQLLEKLQHFKGSVLFIKGVIEESIQTTQQDQFSIVNFMLSDALEKALNESDLVLCRSGYTSILDLTKLEKKAFFIPTPGQDEQLYLAKLLKDQHLAPSCRQEDFTLEKLNEIASFKGLSAIHYDTNFATLFRLFKGE